MRAQWPALIFAVASRVAAQSAAPPAPASPAPAAVGSDAVWAPPEGFLAGMHAACDGGREGSFGACFVEQMTRAGAPAAVVAFARRTDDLGYLREFRDTGRVDVACAEYPFRANENSVCFLVNGEPPMIDVDDASRIDREALAYDATYAALRKKYPNLAIFPGRRTGDLAVRASTLRLGGQRFAVDYSLVDGCHACARVGSLRLGFDFDVAGRFIATRVLLVRALAH